MFWGRGDSSKLSTEERALYDNLRRLEETGHIVGTTPDQTATAFSAIKFFGSVTATSGMIAGARNVMYWIGGLAFFWWTSKDTIVAFLRHVVQP
jgi:hypothetical protein